MLPYSLEVSNVRGGGEGVDSTLGCLAWKEELKDDAKKLAEKAKTAQHGTEHWSFLEGSWLNRSHHINNHKHYIYKRVSSMYTTAHVVFEVLTMSLHMIYHYNISS